VPNLEIISGGKDPLDAADMKTTAMERLREGLRGVDHDYVILDIGPGTSSRMLDLFLLADQGILVTTPEPTSIENTYRFMKCLFLRKMRNTVKAEGDDTLKTLLHKVFSPRWSKRVRTFADIFTELRRLDPVQGARLKSIMKDTGVSVLVNQARGLEDEGLGSLITRGCLDYFDLEVKSLGFIRYDESVKDSVRFRRPLTIHYSGSRAAGAFEACLHRLLEGERRKGTA
jgi:flagellar biosynthesis protein FlhG